MARPSTRSQSLVLGLTWVLACTDDVPSGDEVVEDESTQGDSDEGTDDEAESSSTATSTDDEAESSSSTDESDSDSESESTTDESTSSESTTDESTSEESSSSSSEEESSSSSSDDGMPLECGNGMLDIAEACDDGNNVDGDGCQADCTFTVNIDWMVVHEAPDPAHCSSIMNMGLRVDGDLATTGVAKEDGDYKLHVATWDSENGDVLAEHFGDSLVNAGSTPMLDTQIDGDLLVAYRTAEGGDPYNTIGTVWRFGPDLELTWMKTAADLGAPDTSIYRAVLGKPDGGMLLLSYDPYIRDFDAQGQLLDSQHIGMGSFDIGWVGDRVGATGTRNIGNVYTGVVRTFDLPAIDMSNEALMELEQGNAEWHPWEIDHRGEHIAAVGCQSWLTVWRYNDAGDLIAEHEFPELYIGSTYAPGIGVADDGMVVATTLHRAIGVDSDGTLLWHLPSTALDMFDMGGPYFISFRDAVIDDQGRVYLGAYDAHEPSCFQAVLIRISW